MAEITAALVAKLRGMTGAGMMECKKALAEAKGDVNAAVDVLRKAGTVTAGKIAAREAREGLIAQYIAPDGKVGVLVEVGAGKDSTVANDDFKQLVKDITLQIAAGNPSVVSREQVPAEVLAK